MAPTRRSTRSARPSEEPQPLDDEPVLVAKRKRSSAADSVDKTASRTTRRSSSSKPEPVANTRTRTASRSSTTLKQVQESEDDEIQILPPPKKARSSTDADDVQEVEEVKPPVRSRRAAAPKRGPPAKHEVIVIDDSDDEPAPAIVKPPPRTKSSRKPSMQPKAAPASRVSNGRSSRSASKAIKPDPEEVNDSAVEQGAGSSKVQLEPEDERDDEEEVKPVKGRMAPPKRSTRREVQSTSSVPESDVGPAEEEPQSDGYEDEKSIKPAKGHKAPPKRSTRRAVHSTGTGAESESELASDEDVKPALRRGRKNASTPVSQPSGSGSRTRGRASQGEKPIAPEPEPEPEPEMPWDSDEEVEQLALPPSPKNPPRTPRKEQSPSPAYEEERSLLDMLPPPSPSKASRLQQQPEEPQGPKPRLVIHQLVLVNFKSYAGRQVIGPFHKSFSSIVGPNGSGKSNTIDALLFVFGYRASKMRQGKLSELIHNSAHYPDLDECSVEVHFREIMDLPGPDAFNVIPNSTLIVTRTAYKSSSSKYSINGKNSSLQEVTTLLKGRGIDLDHNRFLILQGEVESISQMPPKGTDHGEGLLEYLEDIIGTSQFKEPIEKSAAEIERINEDRQEKVTRLKIVEKDKNALEGKKREAEQYLRRVNELVRAKSVLFQYYLWKCLEAEETFGVTIEKVERELADEREQNKGNVQLIEALEQNYKERATAWEEVKTFLGDAIKDMAAHEKIEVGLEEKRKHASTKHKKLKRSLQEDAHSRDAALRAIEDNEAKMQEERQKSVELEEQLQREEKALEKIRDSLKDKTQVFHDQIEVKQKELQPWTAKINTKTAEVNVKTSERDALLKKEEEVKAASKEASEMHTQLQSDQENKVKDLSDLKRQRQNIHQQSSDSENLVKKLQDNVQGLRVKVSSSRQRADEARASQAASTSQNKVLESLKSLRKQGRISGFHGRLGELGIIEEKYDVAVSTACGALNNMVVDTVEQGQACLDYLRKQNVGRASLMILDKLNRSSGMEHMQTPENVPRLFDLIKPKEPRFAAAFYKGCGNTLVAADLDQANRIAFGSRVRWRVVTLAGQLIDSSGTMSGGGNYVSRGGMSAKLAPDAVGPDVLRQYEQDSEAAARELDEATRELRKAQEEHDALLRSVPQLDMSIKKANMDVQNGTKRIAEAERRVRELNAQSKPDSGDVARISTLEREIALAKSDLAKLQEKTSAIEAELKGLEKKILEIGGAKLLKQRSTVEGLKLHIEIATNEITKAEVAKDKAERDSVKLSNAMKTHTAGLEESEAELTQLNQQKEEVSSTLSELRSRVEEAQAAAENSKDDLETLKADLDEKTEGIQEFKKKEMELMQKLQDIRQESQRNSEKLEHWQQEHEQLTLEEVSDEEDDDDEEEEGVKPEPTTDGEGDQGTPGPSRVKHEPGQPSAGKKKPRQTSANQLKMYSTAELARFKVRQLIADQELADEKVQATKADLGVLKEYKRREEEWQERAKHLEDVTAQRDTEKAKHDGLRKQRLDEFMAGFNLISLKLKEMYQMITLGGNAELELVDSMDPFSEGIIFSVMPPKKSWRNIANLSGGEKTLSSLALVFALHVFKPTPLYFMDEIDAALDFRNVSIVANYIKDRTKNAQFIIISLRNDMFELSHRLIGIYKTSNQTRSISIDNRSLHAPPPSKEASGSH